MNFFGHDIKKDELLKRIGDISQIGGIRSFEYNDGVSKGVRAVTIKNVCGIDLTVLLDRGLDISHFSYQSIPLGFITKVKETSPVYYESRGTEFLKTFFAGFLTTCGLTNIGFPSEDDGAELGQHGRISNISAESVWTSGEWEGDTYKMWVMGKVRQAKFYGEYLELSRKITVYMDKPKIFIEDSVENIGFKETPLMILYHINFGYPLLDRNSRLLESAVKILPWDEESEKNITTCCFFDDPVTEYKDQVFFHDIEADKDGYSNVALVNPEFNKKQGLGVWLKYNKNSLPYLIQWKYLSEGEYVCGVEPANSYIRGRKVERQEGNLKFIKPGDKVKYKLEVTILESNSDIENFELNYCR